MSYLGNIRNFFIKSNSISVKKTKKLPTASNKFGEFSSNTNIKGADGEVYDLALSPGSVYSVLKDKNLNYTAKVDKINDWGALGIVQSVIQTKSRYAMNVIKFNKDGQAVMITRLHGKNKEVIIEQGKTYFLADGGKLTLETIEKTENSEQRQKLTVMTAEGYTITQTTNPGGFIENRVESGIQGVTSDGVKPKGILGDTFDADDNPRIARDNKGSGILNHEIIHYKEKKIFYYI